jgi:hypothetical protein
MGWNIFKGKKEEEKELSLDQRINTALQKAKQDKREAEKEINDIREWAASAIIDAYAEFFPNSNLTYYRKQYAETALEEYEDIKVKYAAQMDPEMVDKCDNIVKAYLNQIQLRESKLKLFTKIESEYLITKEKLKIANETSEQTDRMKAHTDRLKSMDDDSTETLSEAMTDNYQLEDIKEDLAVKEEYQNQLDKLTTQFSDTGDGSEHDSALAFKDEIDKMLNDMD